MTTADQGTVLTYTTEGGDTEQVWNSRSGVIPDYITTRAGASAWHSGPDEMSPDPPQGMRQVVDGSPGVITGKPGKRVSLGWPGTPMVVEPDHSTALPPVGAG